MRCPHEAHMMSCRGSRSLFDCGGRRASNSNELFGPYSPGQKALIDRLLIFRWTYNRTLHFVHPSILSILDRLSDAI